MRQSLQLMIFQVRCGGPLGFAGRGGGGQGFSSVSHFEQGRGRVSPPSRNVPVGEVVEVVVGSPLHHSKHRWVGWWWWENTPSHDSSKGGVYGRCVSPLSLEM